MAVGGVIGLVATLAILTPGDVVGEVSYERLLAGEVSPDELRIHVEATEDPFWDVQGTGTVELTGVADPAVALEPLLVPQAGNRFIQFDLVVENETYHGLDDESDFRLEDENGEGYDPVLSIVDGSADEWELDEGESGVAVIFFELPLGTNPAELRFHMEHHVHRTVVYRFTS